MRGVVDTNVFVIAALKDSSSPGAVTRWPEEFGGLLTSIVWNVSERVELLASSQLHILYRALRRRLI